MSNRSRETPFERRERLNLEAAIARSSSSTTDMTAQIESGSSIPGILLHPRPFIPDSQSDLESIQQFTTIPNSSISSPENAILPIHSSSIDQGPVPEPREPGWSLEKFHHSNISTDNPSSHLKSKSHHSSSQHSPKPTILAAASSASNTSNNSNPAIPKPLSPRFLAPTTVDTHEDPETSRNVPDQTSVPGIQIIAADPARSTSNQQSSRAGSKPRDPEEKKKRKIKSPDETNVEGDGKRVRKQSAAGKASARSLEIFSNLCPPEVKEPDGRDSIKSNDSAPGGSNKTQRRRVFRDGWVLVSDEETSPNHQRGPPASIEDISRASTTEQPPKQPSPLPEVALSTTKNRPSPPILEIPSSPLSSPSGFSPDEKAFKSRKKTKPSVSKKPGPKKKAEPNTKTKKDRKGAASNSPVPQVQLDSHVSPVANDELSRENSTNEPPANPSPAPIRNSEPGLKISIRVQKDKPPSAKQASTRPSPSRKAEVEKLILQEPAPIVKEKTPSKKDQSKEVNESPSCSSTKAGPQPDASNDKTNSASKAALGRVESNNKKMVRKKHGKGLSLAEILASTNPKTKRGLRIGLPKEEKHRLHININPKPAVQKQVKKKLKVKRGEYDSGEDDRPADNSSSDDDSNTGDKDKASNKKSSKAKAYLSQEDVDVDDDDYKDLGENINYLEDE